MPVAVLGMDTNIVRWEITPEELKSRYQRYLPVVVPLLALLTISTMFFGWQKAQLPLFGGTLAVAYLLAAWWMIRDFSSHPHIYELSDTGVSVGKRNSPLHHYPWSEFGGYVVSTDAQGELNTNRRTMTSRFVSTSDVQQTMKTMETIFGPTYYLIRPIHWYTVWPYWRSVWVQVETDVQGTAHAIITTHRNRIPMERINQRMSNVGLMLGLIAMGIALLFVIILS